MHFCVLVCLCAVLVCNDTIPECNPARLLSASCEVFVPACGLGTACLRHCSFPCPLPPVTRDKHSTVHAQQHAHPCKPWHAITPFPPPLLQMQAPWYADTVRHLASWRYAVVQYTVSGLLPIVTDRVEVREQLFIPCTRRPLARVLGSRHAQAKHCLVRVHSTMQSQQAW